MVMVSLRNKDGSLLCLLLENDRYDTFSLPYDLDVFTSDFCCNLHSENNNTSLD